MRFIGVVVVMSVMSALPMGCVHVPELSPLCAKGQHGERLDDDDLPHGIRRIPCNNAACWTIPTDDKGGVLVVDTGMDVDATELKAHLKKRNLSVRGVLITHGHVDHVGGAAAFGKEGVPVFMNAADVPFLQLSRRHQAIMPLLGQRLLPDPKPPLAFFATHDRQVLRVGEAVVTVLHLPGHTPGTQVFLVEDVLFTGDALVGPQPGGLCAAPPQVSEEWTKGWRALSALSDVPYRYVADGHYGMTQDAKAATREAKERWDRWD